MNALVTSFLVNAMDPDTCLKLGMSSGTGLAGATADMLLDYMRPWATTAGNLPCRKVVLHDGLPEGLIAKFPNVEFVRSEPIAENAWLARFRLLAEWLPGQNFDRLFFTDVNDMGIFGDPFVWAQEFPDVLWAGEEWTPFGQNPWFTDAYVRMTPAWREFYEGQLADKLPLSAGLIGGYKQTVLASVRRLLEIFHEQAPQIALYPLTAWDMLALNHMLFTGGPFLAIKQNDLEPEHPQAGAFLRNSGSIQVFRPPMRNPFLHDRKSVMDRLPMVYDGWCTSRVLEQLRDHPNRAQIIQNMSVPRCWGDGLNHSTVDRTAGLADLALTMFPRHGRLVEAGRGRGVSAELFALLLPEVQIFSIDVADTPEAYARLAPYKNVTMVKDDAAEWIARQPAQSIQAAYLDSDHSYDNVSRELLALRTRMTRGGVIGGHDYCLLCPDVIRAVADYFGKDNPPHRVTSDSSWAYVLL